MNFLLVLSPQYGPAEFGDYTTVSVSGGVLTVEGRDYAFPDLADGAELTMEDFADPCAGKTPFPAERRADRWSAPQYRPVFRL
ncbi:TPA: hypothetical protein SMQ62_004839 [Pseudomonas aeruginosa]|nr:hypothetical protein [Pseudomonas aeruginosa]